MNWVSIHQRIYSQVIRGIIIVDIVSCELVVLFHRRGFFLQVPNFRFEAAVSFRIGNLGGTWNFPFKVAREWCAS